MTPCSTENVMSFVVTFLQQVTELHKCLVEREMIFVNIRTELSLTFVSQSQGHNILMIGRKTIIGIYTTAVK